MYDQLAGEARFTDAVHSYDSQGQLLSKVTSECPNNPCTECSSMMMMTTPDPGQGTANSGGTGGM